MESGKLGRVVWMIGFVCSKKERGEPTFSTLRLRSGLLVLTLKAFQTSIPLECIQLRVGKVGLPPLLLFLRNQQQAMRAKFEWIFC